MDNGTKIRLAIVFVVALAVLGYPFWVMYTHHTIVAVNLDTNQIVNVDVRE